MLQSCFHDEHFLKVIVRFHVKPNYRFLISDLKIVPNDDRVVQ